MLKINILTLMIISALTVIKEVCLLKDVKNAIPLEKKILVQVVN